jgi:hypothetical protein
MRSKEESNNTKPIKQVIEHHKENYKTLKKESEEDTRSWKECLCSLFSRFNIVKIAILPNVLYRFNATSIKIPIPFFTEIEKKILKFM